jgi:hypothetical protein
MSGTKKARVFVPLMKVDEEQRLVFGKITAQEVDQSGEMMDYDTSKPNFESWSVADRSKALEVCRRGTSVSCTVYRLPAN